MKKLIFSALIFLLALSFCSSFASATDDAEFARWQELKEGQEGYMLTVLQGTKIIKIKVKYIGTTPHPASDDERAIVVELIDQNVIPKDATAVAGTSGSPAYFEVRGQYRLVGATAFMFNDFPKNGTIMGVTPIEAMISGKAAAQNQLKLPLVIQDKKFGRLRITWLPIYFDQKNSVPADEQKAQSSRRPEPGDSVTVIFPGRGGAICTVTYIRGNRYWACGHGIMGETAFGEQKIAFQSYRTQITMTLFSAKDSYKLFDRNLEFFGTIIKNTPFGIEGVIHEKDKPIE